MAVKTTRRKYTRADDERIYKLGIGIFDQPAHKRAAALKVALTDLGGVNQRSALSCIKAVSRLLDGKPITWRLANVVARRYMKWIKRDRPDADFRNAVKSLKAHIKWRRDQIRPLKKLHEDAQSGNL